MNRLRFVVAVVVVVVTFPAVAQHQMDPAMPAAAGTPLTLAALERLAADHNPTLAQGRAAVAAAEGMQDQAGRYPNPGLGAEVDDLAFRQPGDSAQYWFEINQPIPIARERGARRAVAGAALAQARIEAAAQAVRVRAGVRSLYYEAISAADQVALHRQLAELAREAVGVTAELVNVGSADATDLLAARSEAARFALDSRRAEIHLRKIRRQLAAVVGVETVEFAPLEADLTHQFPEIDYATALADLLASSLELEFARGDLDRATAMVQRARATGGWRLAITGAVGWNTERLGSAGERVGWQGRAGFTLQPPVFDAHQGEVLAARAFAAFAEAGVRRVELSLRSRMAAVYEEYEVAVEAWRTYDGVIVPAAVETVELLTRSHARMAAAYPQLLVARRDLLEANIEATDALDAVWQAAVALEARLLLRGLAAPGISMQPSMVMPAGVGHGQ